jgi:hypothetical protein
VLEAHYIIATLPDQYGSDEIRGQYGSTKFATKIAGKGLENENERQVVELAPSKP